MNEFKIGDVVYLKSDSEHKFTVCEVSKDTIKVIFFNPITQTFCYSERIDSRFFNQWIDL